MSKDYFHDSVLTFADWVGEQDKIGGLSWAQLFDLPKLESYYLSRFSSDMHREEWVQAGLLAIRDGDVYEAVKLRRVIFHITGLINTTDKGEIEDDEWEEDILEKKELLEVLDHVTHAGEKDNLLACLDNEWKRFHRVTDVSDLCSIDKAESSLKVSKITKITFDDGQTQEQDKGTEEYFECERSTLAWKEQMGDILEKIWRKDTSLSQDQLLSFDDGVLLEMSNGKMLTLFTSEWGAIGGLRLVEKKSDKDQSQSLGL